MLFLPELLLQNILQRGLADLPEFVVHALAGLVDFQDARQVNRRADEDPVYVCLFVKLRCRAYFRKVIWIRARNPTHTRINTIIHAASTATFVSGGRGGLGRRLNNYGSPQISGEKRR